MSKLATKEDRAFRREFPQSGQKKLSAEEQRKKILESFHPSALEYLRNLGINVEKLPVSTLYDISKGNVTKPLEVTVRPVVYDRAAKKYVTAQPLTVCASFSFVFPYQKVQEGGRTRIVPKAIGDKKEDRVYMASYPCYPYVKKVDPLEIARMVVPQDSEQKDQKKEMPKLTDAQITALAAVGIDSDRLFGKGLRNISVDVKNDIISEKTFDVDGAVTFDTGFGYNATLNLCGQARLVNMEDGSILPQFLTNYAVEKRQDEIIDLYRLSKIGMLDLDFVEHTPSGSTKRDLNGLPVINAAGKELVKYGYTLRPVDGYVHRKELVQGSQSYVDRVEKRRYSVSVVNGGLCCKPLALVPEVGKDGKNVKVMRDGKEEDKMMYAVPVDYTNDNKIRLEVYKADEKGRLTSSYQTFSFASEAECDSYRKGYGGIVKDYKFYDRDTSETTTGDAFVINDNKRCNSPHVFSQKVSSEIIEARHPSQERKVENTRRQNFSMGL